MGLINGLAPMLDWIHLRKPQIGLVTFMSCSLAFRLLSFFPFVLNIHLNKWNDRDLWNSICHSNATPHKRKLNSMKRIKFGSSSSHFCRFSGTSNVCHVSSDCPLNSTCEPRSGYDGQCVCKDGYFMKASGKSRACIQIADYGELCYMDQQCEFRLGLFAECQNGQCSCKDGSHYIVNENACFKSSSELIFLWAWHLTYCKRFALFRHRNWRLLSLDE